MESLYLLIPLSVIVVFIALWIFFRAMDSGQFDDLDGPGLRILQDDDRQGVRGDTGDAGHAGDIANAGHADQGPPRPVDRPGSQ